MSLRPSLVVLVLAAVAVLAVVVGAQRLAAAEAVFDATLLALDEAEADAHRVTALRAAQQVVAENRRPDQDVIRRVNEALAQAGIDQGRFAGLRPSSDTALAGQDGPQYRRQNVQVSLSGLTVPEIGAFLAAWAESGELWTPTDIDLTHARTAGDEGRYNMTMMLGATYVADP